MPNNIVSKNLKVGELDIRYFTGGQGDPLVIIHGGGSTASSAWLRNAEELSRHYSLYVPDLPGFGCSESMGDDFHLSRFTQFVQEFSRSLGLKRFNLVGHSIGGAIALHYALEYPQKVTRLVLVSSFCLGKETALWVRILTSPAFIAPAGEAAIALIKALKWVAGRFYAPLAYVNPIPRVSIDMGKTMTTMKGQTMVALDRLSDLIMPTLLVWGARDNIVPASHAYAAAPLIHNCQVRVFEDSGHNVYREKVKEFSQLLFRFLN